MSNEITIISPETGTVSRLGAALLHRANALMVSDEESHAEAQILLQDIKRARTTIVDEIFAKPKKLAHQTWRAFCESERKLTDPADHAKRIISGKIDTYEDHERARAEKEAREQEAAARQAEEEAVLRDAVALEEAGDLEGAQEVLDAASDAPEPVIPPAPRLAKVQRVHGTRRWSFTVDDKLKVLRHVIENPEHLEGVELVSKYWNQLARAQRKRMAIPGMRAVSSTTKTVRA